ncbi:MAG: Bax inhibitor-1 family protein [Bacilli bacterium]|nr:Bax inhibitor-1 family protein [Bacilli bacterium]
MGKVYLYMGFALLITAAFAFGFGALFSGLLTGWTYDLKAINYNNVGIFYAYIGVLIASGIGVLITGIVMHSIVARGRHSAWPAYIIYSSLIGILVSAFLVVGIDFVTLGEAFVISAIAFGTMGLIGYFSKRNLSILAMIGFVVLISLSLFGFTMLFTFIFFPGALRLFSIIYNAVILFVLLLMVAVDTQNVRRIMETGSASNNLCLLCAYIMYTDFINIFIRVLFILMRFKRN